VLSFVEMFQDEQGGIQFLGGARAVAVSPDGGQVYAAAYANGALNVFTRNGTTGQLTFLEAQNDGVNGVDGLDGVTALAISPDGANVYSAGFNEDAIAVFRRDPATGALTFVEVQRNGVGAVKGIQGPRGLALDPTGSNLYVTGHASDALVVFARDAASGVLTFVEEKKNGRDDVEAGLNGAYGVAVDPDGAHVYATSDKDDGVAVFERTAPGGTLLFREVERDGVGGVDGLAGAKGIAVSPDGGQVYVAGADKNALAVFSRNAATGGLTFIELEKDGTGSVDGLNGAFGIAVSSDATSVYVTGADDDAVAVFGNRCGNGVLDPSEQCDDGNTRHGDGCSAGCRLECVESTSCDDGDPCTEDRCTGECVQQRCGFAGAGCELTDLGPALTGDPQCTAMPGGLRQALKRRIKRATRIVRRTSRSPNPDLQRALTRIGDLFGALETKASLLVNRHKLTDGCRDDVKARLQSVDQRLQRMLLRTGSCAS
jgi:cysteine-rich repeat protein